MPRAYTTRFISTGGAGNLSRYVVPAGRRAVVRNVGVGNFDSAAQPCWLIVAGRNLWYRSIPGGNATVHDEVRLVAFVGEAIEFQTVGPAMSAQVAGYLFVDDGTERGPGQLPAPIPPDPPPPDHNAP